MQVPPIEDKAQAPSVEVEHAAATLEGTLADQVQKIDGLPGRGLELPGRRSAQINDISPTVRRDWSRTIFVLVFLHVLVVVAFALGYLGLATSIRNQIHVAVFVSASIVWFALCGLLSTILAQVTLAILAEVRIATSRQYLQEQIETLHAIGIEQGTLAVLVQQALYREVNTAPVDAKNLAPVLKVFEAIESLVETVGKRRG